MIGLHALGAWIDKLPLRRESGLLSLSEESVYCYKRVYEGIFQVSEDTYHLLADS